MKKIEISTKPESIDERSPRQKVLDNLAANGGKATKTHQGQEHLVKRDLNRATRLAEVRKNAGFKTNPTLRDRLKGPGNALVSAAAVGLLIGGAVVYDQNEKNGHAAVEAAAPDNGQNGHIGDEVTIPSESIEANALSGELKTAAGALEVPQGAEVLSAPAHEATNAFTVLEGNVLRVSEPVTVTTEDGNFYGFTMNGQIDGNGDVSKYEPLTNESGNPVWPVYWVPEGLGQFTPDANLQDQPGVVTYSEAFGFSQDAGHKGGSVAQAYFEQI